MKYPDLVAYIAEQSAEGVSAQSLREELMESGWLQTDIENALHDVAAGLAPTTPGVSIHSDLAQVRSMVAHLAGRVREIETRLTAVGALPMQKELPAPTPRRFIWLGHFTALAWGVACFVLLGHYFIGQLILLVFAGFAGLIMAFIALGVRRTWLAAFLSDSAAAFWAYAIWTGYRSGAMQWTIALGLGVLVVVVTLLMGKWIDRRARR